MDEGSNKNKKDNFEFKVVRVKVSLNTGGMSDGKKKVAKCKN